MMAHQPGETCALVSQRQKILTSRALANDFAPFGLPAGIISNEVNKYF